MREGEEEGDGHGNEVREKVTCSLTFARSNSPYENPLISPTEEVLLRKRWTAAGFLNLSDKENTRHCGEQRAPPTKQFFLASANTTRRQSSTSFS